jgi:DNA polymerase epsilon subunit 3
LSPLDEPDTNTNIEKDLLLPRTLTSRLARGILPANTSIQKDALLALTKSATVFISYLAATANEQSTKKTIGPNDVLAALKEMELGPLMELDGREGGGRLERELEAWETVVKGKRKGYREKVKGRQSGVGAEGEDGEERGEPETKRARVTDGDETMETSTPNGDGHTNGDGESHHHPKTMFSDDDEPLEDTYQEDADATEDDGIAEDEEEEQEEEKREEDTLDNYGPDEQLRRDILLNGDDAGGTEEESD